MERLKSQIGEIQFKSGDTITRVEYNLRINSLQKEVDEGFKDRPSTQFVKQALTILEQKQDQFNVTFGQKFEVQEIAIAKVEKMFEGYEDFNKEFNIRLNSELSKETKIRVLGIKSNQNKGFGYSYQYIFKKIIKKILK